MGTIRFGLCVRLSRTNSESEGRSKFSVHPSPLLLSAVVAVCLCALLLLPSLHHALAQDQAPAQPLVNLGDAIVTGFSGVREGDSTSETGKTDKRQLFIDPDGATLRGFDLSNPQAKGPLGQPLAPEFLSVTARDIGQVFGIALDDATDPSTQLPASNIYTTATSIYGLPIVGSAKDTGGSPERHTSGATEARWMEGLFGEDKGGGPGSVWKIDGLTGEVALFANITHDKKPNSGAALGNIAFDGQNKQLFVSDRDTGLIHRLDMIGNLVEEFDHGVDGRTAIGLEAVPLDEDNRADITSKEFKSDDPSTWGLADPRRQVWGLAVHDERLYYAVADGPKIWSVDLKSDGSFDAASARWEIDLPEDTEPHEIADIAFTRTGEMILAQRPPVSGNTYFRQLVKEGAARLLRYQLESPDDTATKSRWIATPDEYAIGLAGEHRNATGGIALGYGYGQDGNIDPDACEATLWATGDGLRENPLKTVKAQKLPQGGMADGFQGTPVDMVRPDNVLPTGSFVINYDGQFPQMKESGHVGDIEIASQCPGEPGAPLSEAPMPAEPGLAPGAPMPGEPGLAPPGVLPPGDPGPAPGEAPSQEADLLIEKQLTQPCQPGGDCAFEITVTNQGPGEYQGPLILSDTISVPGVTLAANAPAPWNCRQEGDHVSCTHPTLLLKPGHPISLPLTLRDPGDPKTKTWENCVALTWLGPAAVGPGSVRAVQTELAGLGHYTGPIDGIAGAKTEQAIRDIEKASGLPEVGKITPEFLDWLFGPGASTATDPNPDNDRACATVDTDQGATAAKQPPPPTGAGQWGMSEPEKQPPPPAGAGAWSGPGAKAVFNISKSGKSPCRYEAEECVFTVTISNTGNKDFDGGVFLTDEWLPGWTLTKAPADWKCSHPEPAKWRCANWVKLLVGGPPVTTSWSFKAPPDFNPDGGSVVKTNCAWALGKKACFQIKLEKGPKTEPDERPTATFDLTIKKGPPHDAPGAVAGAGMFYVCEPLQPCPFTVTITNIGKDKYEGPFSFIDMSTGGWSYGGVSPGWSCSPVGDAFSCTGKVSLAPGQSTTVNISLNPMPDVPVDPVQGENCVEIDWKGGPGDANKDNDGRDCMPVILSVGAPKAEAPEEPGKPPATVAPDLTVEKRATRTICEPGEECEFIIIIRGTQGFPLKDKFKVSDTPPKGWTFAGGGKHGLWSCKTDKDKFTTCSYDIAKNPNLPPEGFTSSDVLATDIRFKVPSDAEHGVYINSVWVKFEKVYKHAYAEVQVGLRPNMEVSKTFDNAVCAPMEECSFIITVKNSGKGPYTGSLDITDTVKDRRLIVEYVESHPKWDCSITADPGTGQPGGVSCSRPGSFPHGTTEIAARVKAKIKDDAKSSELENCAVLKLRGKKASSLSKDEIQACDEIQIGEETAITIEKSGPFLKTALTPEMTPGPGYQTGDPSKCNSNDICTFLIQIKPNWKGVYVAPLGVQDRMPQGWKAVDYEDKKDWSCAGMGTNIVRCLYNKGQAPVVMSQPIPLLIHAQVPDYSWHATVESDLENCSYIMVQHGAGYKKSTKPKHEHCIDFAVRHKSYKYGSNAFAMQESGTESCAPPADCSYYEFTATRTNIPNASYAGPLSIRVTPPPGSEFPTARITTSAKSCPASGWSCTKTGKEFGGVHTCRISQCVIAPGEQIIARLDGRVVPGMTEPPPTDLKKTGCGVLEWDERPNVPVDIEQRGGKRTKKACHTVTVKGKPKPVTCPKEQGWKPYPEDTALLPGWKLKKFGTGANAIFCMKREKVTDLQVSTAPKGKCTMGQTCAVGTLVSNVGRVVYAESIEVRGKVSPPVSIRSLIPSSGWNCRTVGGGRYTCRGKPANFAPGKSARINLGLAVPRNFRHKQITHSVRIAWPDGKGDANPANDLSIFTIPIFAPSAPPPPPPPVVVTPVPPKAPPARPQPAPPIAAPPGCPDGQVRIRGRCVCPSNRPVWTGRQCIPKLKPAPPIAAPPRCPDGQVRIRGRCVCPSNRPVWTGRQCIPKLRPAPMPAPPPCTGDKVRVGNRCVCPGNSVDFRGSCVPCPPGKKKVGNRCERIPQPSKAPFAGVPLPKAPQIQMIPMLPICPPNHYWDQNKKKCMVKGTIR